MTPDEKRRLIKAVLARKACLKDASPLSFAQQRLWFLEQLEPGVPAYHIAGAIWLRGPLSVTALAKSLNAVVARHASLRTVFREADGVPVQVVQDAVSLDIPVIDLGDLPPEARADEAMRRGAAEAKKPFDLRRGPLVRMFLYRIDAETHLLALSIHHIIFDGWSMRIFYRELGLFYGHFLEREKAGDLAAAPPESLPGLPPLRLEYADFARRQRERLRGPVLEAELAHWRGKLDGAPPALDLPTDRPRPDIKAYQGARARFVVPSETTASLREVGRLAQATLFMTLLAGFYALLGRMSGQEDIVVGTAIANRTEEEVEGIIGFFANTLALRADLSGDPTFQELVGRVKATSLDAYAHQELPFEKLVEELSPARSLSRQPIFQVMFAFQNAVGEPLTLPGLSVESTFLDTETSLFDLTLSLEEDGGGQVTGSLQWDSELFDAATAQAIMKDYVDLLGRAAASPSARLSELARPASTAAAARPPASAAAARLAASEAGAGRQGGGGGGGGRLSFAQERLWFLDRLDPGSPAYNLPLAFRIKGGLDEAVLARCLDEIVRRHEALRTSFPSVDGKPIAVVAPAGPVAIKRVSVEALSPGRREDAAYKIIVTEARRPFDLGSGPVVRAVLVTLGPDDRIFLFVFHHIVSDGWSVDLFFRELAALYEAFSTGRPSPLPELPIQYGDFAAWQRDWLQGEVLERQLGYWRERLAGLETLELPTDRPRRPMVGVKGGVENFRVPDDVSEALASLARREGASLYMTLLSAFEMLLARYTGQTDVAVGTPIANRNRTEIENLMGFFVNTLVLRTDLRGDPSFREVLARVRETAIDSYDHQDLPFEVLVEALEPARDLSRPPLFQVMFVLQNVGDLSLRLSGLTMDQISITTGAAKFDLLLAMREIRGKINGAVEYSAELFDPSTVRRLIDHFLVLLRSVATDPDRRLSRLDLVGPDERRLVTEEWNKTASPYPGCLVHDLFQARARLTPDRVAVAAPSDRLGESDRPGERGGEVAGKGTAAWDAALGQPFPETLTYAELDHRADLVAEKLRSLGVGPDVPVGVCLRRSAALPVGVIGVLKAGGVYVPLDPDYPAERLGFMASDAGLKVLVTEEALRGRVPTAGETGPRVLSLDGDWPEIMAAGERGQDAAAGPVGGSADAAAPCPDNLAYITYTSGSTGRPKGVAMPHRALVNLLVWQGRRTARQGGAKPPTTLAFSALSFDVSFQEMFSTWLEGGTLVVVPDSTRRDLGHLPAVMEELGVDRLFLPYVALAGLARAAVETGVFPRGLVEITTAGERLEVTPTLAAFFAGLNGCVLDNQYGPTETHVVSAHRLEGEPGEWPVLPPIGRPVANTRLYVLDEAFGPAPIGVPGELCLGGDCLARGYLGRPDLTAERFVPDPWGPATGGRLYRTGDLARWLPSGEIEFLGRRDLQVKVRGFRVEPGEIEAALCRHPGVAEAVVVAREDSPGEKRLVAYVVPGGEIAAAADRTAGATGGAAAGLQAGPQAPLAPIDLKSFLDGLLPEHMVPASYVFLERLPLTPSGKVDRRALPAPDRAGFGLDAEYVAPETEVEKALAGMWSELLGVSRVGTLDNFFALGGHSLLATQVVARCRQLFGVEIPVRQLFASPTIGTLAARIEEAREEAKGQAADASLAQPPKAALSGRPAPDAAPAPRAAGAPVPSAGPAPAPVPASAPTPSPIAAGAALPIPPIRPVPRTGDLALSFSQERLWFLDRFDPGSPAYNIPVAVRFKGKLDTGALKRSLDEIVRRHEALRTSFPAIEGRPVERISPPGPMALEEVDLQALPARERSSEVARRVEDDAYRPFDLAEGPLIRAGLYTITPEDHVLFVNTHHIVSDGWSLSLFFRELYTLYAAFRAGEPSPLPELPIQYADFAAWQKEWLRGEALEAQMAYWKEALADLETLNLPTDYPRPPVQTTNGAVVEVRLPAELRTALRGLERREGVSSFMLLLAAFAMLLASMSGQDDIAVGVPIAGRNRAEIEPLIGFFVNTLVMRVRLDGNPTFREVLARVREVALEAYDHQDVPFEALVEAVQPARDISRPPLFQVMFSLQNNPGLPSDPPGLRTRIHEITVRTAKFDLSFALADTPDGFAGAMEYNTDLFARETVARMSRRLEAILRAAVRDPGFRLPDLDLVLPEERTRLRAWNETAVAYPSRLVHEFFEEWAAKAPGAVAVVDAAAPAGPLELSYGELDQRAGELAARLREQGAGPDKVVGVLLGRSWQLVSALLGVLKSGAAQPRQPGLRHLHLGLDGASQGRNGHPPKRGEPSSLPRGPVPPHPPGQGPPEDGARVRRLGARDLLGPLVGGQPPSRGAGRPSRPGLHGEVHPRPRRDRG